MCVVGMTETGLALGLTSLHAVPEFEASPSNSPHTGNGQDHLESVLISVEVQDRDLLHLLCRRLQLQDNKTSQQQMGPQLALCPQTPGKACPSPSAGHSLASAGRAQLCCHHSEAVD